MQIKLNVRCLRKTFVGEKPAWFDKAKTREQLKPSRDLGRGCGAIKDFGSSTGLDNMFSMDNVGKCVDMPSLASKPVLWSQSMPVMTADYFVRSLPQGGKLSTRH
eukprot:6278496-Karenia_brevis.AAC.1